MVPTNLVLIGKTQNFLHHGPPKLLNAINEIQSMVIFIVEKEYHNVAMNGNNLENEEIYDPCFL